MIADVAAAVLVVLVAAVVCAVPTGAHLARITDADRAEFAAAAETLRAELLELGGRALRPVLDRLTRSRRPLYTRAASRGAVSKPLPVSRARQAGRHAGDLGSMARLLLSPRSPGARRVPAPGDHFVRQGGV